MSFFNICYLNILFDLVISSAVLLFIKFFFYWGAQFVNKRLIQVEK